jgi:hypothetical protein
MDRIRFRPIYRVAGGGGGKKGKKEEGKKEDAAAGGGGGKSKKGQKTDAAAGGGGGGRRGAVIFDEDSDDEFLDKILLSRGGGATAAAAGGRGAFMQQEEIKLLVDDRFPKVLEMIGLRIEIQNFDEFLDIIQTENVVVYFIIPTALTMIKRLEELKERIAAGITTINDKDILDILVQVKIEAQDPSISIEERISKFIFPIAFSLREITEKYFQQYSSLVFVQQNGTDKKTIQANRMRIKLLDNLKKKLQGGTTTQPLSQTSLEKYQKMSDELIKEEDERLAEKLSRSKQQEEIRELIVKQRAEKEAKVAAGLKDKRQKPKRQKQSTEKKPRKKTKNVMRECRLLL